MRRSAYGLGVMIFQYLYLLRKAAATIAPFSGPLLRNYQRRTAMEKKSNFFRISLLTTLAYQVKCIIFCGCSSAPSNLVLTARKT
jgi:hypothetical protein